MKKFKLKDSKLDGRAYGFTFVNGETECDPEKIRSLVDAGKVEQVLEEDKKFTLNKSKNKQS